MSRSSFDIKLPLFKCIEKDEKEGVVLV